MPSTPDQPTDLAGATSPGPPDSYPSTPGEFAARWNARTDDERAAWLHAMVEALQHLATCRVQRFAMGGYVGPDPRLADTEALVVLHPDLGDCFISAQDARASRMVCSRPDHHHAGPNV